MYRAAATNSPGPVGSKLLKGEEVSSLIVQSPGNQDSDQDGDQGDHRDSDQELNGMDSRNFSRYQARRDPAPAEYNYRSILNIWEIWCSITKSVIKDKKLDVTSVHDLVTLVSYERNQNDDGIVKNDITLHVGKPDTNVLQRNNVSLHLGRDKELYEAQILHLGALVTQAGHF